ncbi:LysM peptidoglycan-binding domain-containing protein [Brevibacillus daliensis]|uniref:LysM peptidoglycan-binding domain-containing protein n=1 Tax=Brevibacillus daliensis TaxID=2892995 RepID=UPI001E30B5C6|nr:LysM peptidoglycan-binding domain-containing protein [Brevibacillus daliensis]
MSVQDGLLSFQMRETVFLSSDKPDIDELRELELLPDLEIRETDAEINIVGSLQLLGKYAAQRDASTGAEGGTDTLVAAMKFTPLQMEQGESPSILPEENEAISHRIPVSISIPLSRTKEVGRVFGIVDSFDYEIKGPRHLVIMANVIIEGVTLKDQDEIKAELQANKQPNAWEYIHVANQQESADNEYKNITIDDLERKLAALEREVEAQFEQPLGYDESSMEIADEIMPNKQYRNPNAYDTFHLNALDVDSAERFREQHPYFDAEEQHDESQADDSYRAYPYQENHYVESSDQLTDSGYDFHSYKQVSQQQEPAEKAYDSEKPYNPADYFQQHDHQQAPSFKPYTPYYPNQQTGYMHPPYEQQSYEQPPYDQQSYVQPPYAKPPYPFQPTSQQSYYQPPNTQPYSHSYTEAKSNHIEPENDFPSALAYQQNMIKKQAASQEDKSTPKFGDLSLSQSQPAKPEADDSKMITKEESTFSHLRHIAEQMETQERPQQLNNQPEQSIPPQATYQLTANGDPYGKYWEDQSDRDEQEYQENQENQENQDDDQIDQVTQEQEVISVTEEELSTVNPVITDVSHAVSVDSDAGENVSHIEETEQTTDEDVASSLEEEQQEVAHYAAVSKVEEADDAEAVDEQMEEQEEAKLTTMEQEAIHVTHQETELNTQLPEEVEHVAEIATEQTQEIISTTDHTKDPEAELDLLLTQLEEEVQAEEEQIEEVHATEVTQAEPEKEIRVAISPKGNRQEDSKMNFSNILSHFSGSNRSVKKKEDQNENETHASKETNALRPRSTGLGNLTSFTQGREEKYSKLKMCIIQRNDTLETIAQRYDVSISRLREANKLTGERIEEGQIIYIPL